MSLKIRLLIAVLLIVVLSVVASAFSFLHISVSESRDALQKAAQERLVSQADLTREQISEYFHFIEAQIRTKAASVDVIDAAQQFTQAFNDYAVQRRALTDSEQRKLSDYYQKQFLAQYNIVNTQPLDQSDNLLRQLGETERKLQFDFIAGSRHPLGNKDELIKPDSETDYAEIHERFHPALRQFQSEFGYYDVFIADAKSGHIVYSVFKELDFATSLRSGPYAQTGIGNAFAQALRQDGEAVVTEFARYLPSYDALAGFISSPIKRNGETIAVLIFQIPLDRISHIMTHDHSWQDNGFGQSGETYLVTDDGYLLSESRFYLEDESGYHHAVQRKYPEVAKEVALRGTTVGIQPVESESALLARQGKSGFMTVSDYRGVEVFSAYLPLFIGDNQLSLLAEVDVSEALQPAENITSSLVWSAAVIIALVLIVATIVVLWVSKLIVRPIEKLGDTCEQLASGRGDLTYQIAYSGLPEVDRVSGHFNQFIEQIRDIITQVKSDSHTLSAAAEELSAISDQSVGVTKLQREQSESVMHSIHLLNESVEGVAAHTEGTSSQTIDAEKSLKENMDRADLAAKNIRLLVQLIADSSEVIGSLKNEVNQITQVLNVITGIADQTNLLALNAAIEAARAGDAGRGFSVVADEVRALAIRSQENTVQIANLVDVMSSSSDKSVESMERATAAADGGIHLVDLVTVALDELSQILRQVSELADSVSTVTSQQRETANSVTESMNRINDISREVSEGAVQTSSSAHELAQIAEKTNELVSRFKVD